MIVMRRKWVQCKICGKMCAKAPPSDKYTYT